MLLYNLITNWEWQGAPVTNYSWFHIMWILIMILECVIFSLVFAKKHNKKIDDRFVFTMGLILLIAEIYKQVFYTIDHGYYLWDAFPFQFCSVPMYFAVIAPLVKNEKIKNGMYKFLASFGLVAGIAVMSYPGDCFHTSYTTILIHTMLWHSSMVVIGIYLIVAKGLGKNLKELLPAFGYFAIVLGLALSANIIAYHTYFKFPELNVHNCRFFLFYISPYYMNPFPILSDIKENVSFTLFLLLYVVVFFIGIARVWSVIMGLRKLFSKKNC